MNDLLIWFTFIEKVIVESIECRPADKEKILFSRNVESSWVYYCHFRGTAYVREYPGSCRIRPRLGMVECGCTFIMYLHAI